MPDDVRGDALARYAPSRSGGVTSL